jgi:hypothetical protein
LQSLREFLADDTLAHGHESGKNDIFSWRSGQGLRKF